MKLFVFSLLVIAITASSITEQRLAAMSKLTYSSLFSEIQAQITSGGPLTSILDTIERFDSQIRTEQAEHDAMWAIQQADCEQELTFRNGEIADGTDANKRASTHHRTCSDSLERARVDEANNAKDQVDTQSALSALTNIREQQHDLFLGEEKRHEHALTVLADASDFLDTLVAGEAGLLELSSHTMNLITTGTRIGVMKAYAPVITLLAQMAASEEDVFVDESAIDRVKRMIAEMVGTVRVNLENLTGAEQQLQEEFNSVTANLNASLRDLRAIEARLSVHIDDMESCVLEEETVMTAAAEKVRLNTEMLNTATAMCNSFANEYRVATEGRNQERDLLRIIRQLAEKRMVRYRDANTETKYGEGYGAGYSNMDDTMDQYTATSTQWQ